MAFTDFYLPILGGGLIGLSASLLLLFNGRVAGISGIVSQALKPSQGYWRLAFLGGLFCGGFILQAFWAESFLDTSERSLIVTAAAGLLVGFGTAVGNGCTSGHGVCGISRFSIRSLVATVVFISLGMITVTLCSH